MPKTFKRIIVGYPTPSAQEIHGKKTSVHRMENEDLIHGKRGILQTFTHVLRTENPTFSVCFRIGESQHSFHYTVVFLRGKCR